ncbi:Ger(x)C family spore germination protein [Clostridium sp. OS1-26]|uniref:Ger(x)C family spore germination protein n=1 Tax=Clostridium sp. OS1-26 TaxID=3070681 RepID=UPI0027E0AD63|nr:Ger(x)C family spore germination protein [Clostridium sp. OS1-26]WML37527.1 Ger(x)C family spore germination protein [Clostridium sp. OS1-26]
MIKRYNKVIITLLLPLYLTGCWDYKDINKRSIDLSIGVDNVEDQIEFTGEIAKLTSSNTQGRSMLQIVDVYKYRTLGKHFEESNADYNIKVPFPNFSGAARVIAFSKKYVEKKGIESYINRAYFTIWLRNSVPVVICKESANELFTGKIENDISIGYGIEDTIRYLNETGATLYKTVQDIQTDIQFGNIGFLLPYITKEDNKNIKYLGFAAMKDSKLIDIIDYKKSTGFLYLVAKKTTVERVIPHPKNEKNLVSVKSVLGKRSIRTKYEDNKINIYIDLKLNAQIQYEYSIEPLSKVEINKIEDTVSNMAKEEVMYAINRSQNEMHCDVFGFAKYFRAKYPIEYKRMNWKEEYQKANFHVNVKTTIKNTTILDPNGKKPD